MNPDVISRLYHSLHHRIIDRTFTRNTRHLRAVWQELRGAHPERAISWETLILALGELAEERERIRGELEDAHDDRQAEERRDFLAAQMSRLILVAFPDVPPLDFPDLLNGWEEDIDAWISSRLAVRRPRDHDPWEVDDGERDAIETEPMSRWVRLRHPQIAETTP